MGSRPEKQPIEETANGQEVQAQTEAPVKGTPPLYSKPLPQNIEDGDVRKLEIKGYRKRGSSKTGLIDAGTFYLKNIPDWVLENKEYKDAYEEHTLSFPEDKVLRVPQEKSGTI